MILATSLSKVDQHWLELTLKTNIYIYIFIFIFIYLPGPDIWFIKKEGTHSDWFEKKDKVSKKSKKDSKQSASGIQISPIAEKLGIVFKLCHFAR